MPYDDDESSMSYDYDVDTDTLSSMPSSLPNDTIVQPIFGKSGKMVKSTKSCNNSKSSKSTNITTTASPTFSPRVFYDDRYDSKSSKSVIGNSKSSK